MIGRADDRNTGARLASADAATPAQRPGEGAPAADLALVKRLLAGDEATFTHLVERYHGRLLRLARLFVANHAVAEEVVQDTWLAVLKGLPAFEGRSALKSWMFTILTNLAKTRAIREKRSIPFSALSRPGIEEEPTVQPDRFTSRGAWSAPPRRWDDDTPEQLLLRREALALVEQTIAGLPPTQRAVVTLRDVDGLDAAEVCAILELSEANQRVLLHRARSKVRSVLERHLTSGHDPLYCPPASRSRSAANSCPS
ncbi:MAG: sigma-70 family RNA polymerase sigma factor [Acidobacteria bacterium]|nr:sigma-70 family RNA polymerase sigma factor [Acidobacteriota bacterium]